ncbi:arylsulfatase B-like [Ostrinia furnacalis]|uniref:arylsulfatase B-like n=1 Tax=Ostrinia furnacalis TaxID=93504 RepID=UPI0010408A4F|nr:arylsulfatase B-like [Ostrinia furnacalis]
MWRQCIDKSYNSKFVQLNKIHPIRMGTFYILFIAVISAVVVHGTFDMKKQNIVFIMADDLGWNDVSFHGTDQILTPNIDMLGYSGVALERYYSHCICTPSRSAFLTGKYAHVTGMQGYPLTNSEDRGLPITEKILPQYLKELGYATHLVGKWHVGGSRGEYLPLKRGFDTHFGHMGGFVDYYEYTLEEKLSNDLVSGLNLYRNETPAWDVEGYLTDLYNKEAISIIKSHDESTPLFLMLAHMAPHGSNDGALLQAPPQDVRTMRHVESPERRIFAAMVKKLDDSVGDVVEALEEKGILNNTIIVFVSDNGAMTSGNSVNYGSNWPLRGLKMSPFEGGIRLAGVMWTPLPKANHLYRGYVHVVDWLPTLLNAVGAELPNNIDGISLWDDIIINKESSRKEMFEIDDMFGFASIISNDFKLVTGNVTPEYSDYQGGGSLLRIIGKPPSYFDAIKKSKAYKSLEKIDRLKDTEYYKNVRNTLKVNCDHIDESQICYTKSDKLCLFNIKDDPCETKDLSALFPDLVESMLLRLTEEKKRLIPRSPLYRNPKSNPAFFNYTWTTFADHL